MPLASSNESLLPKMKMEVDFGSREDLSEDDNPPTDSSEDSVEVKVTPITRPQKYPSNLSGIPYKFRKALTQSYIKTRSPSPTRKLVPPSPPPPVKENLKNPEEYPASASSPPAEGGRTSPKTNRASPQAPLSPGTSARARANRRKAAEPRKLCADQDVAIKRSREDDSSHKPNKFRRVSEIHRDAFSLLPPHPHSLISQRSTLMPPFVPPGGFPPILIPPWPPVARHPYSHFVGNIMAPSFGLLPAALPHPSYPLIPLVHQDIHPSHINHLSHRILSNTSRPPSEITTQADEDKPIPLVSREEKASIHSNRERLKDHNDNINNSNVISAPNGETQSVGLPYPKPSKVPSKFLSVESLLASDNNSLPNPSPPSCSEHVPLVKEETDLQEEETIQSLLQQPKQKQRNYKNMTRERRIEANARERTRVHTISAAFEKLRKSVPSYSHNQKLSKLSVLRIACSYILSLSRLDGQDYSVGETNPTFEDCVDLTTRTIQVEGKAKKKRDD